MRVLSLFDGIACARVALDRVGIKVDEYYASEIDAYAMIIAQRNWKDVFEVGSIIGLLESGWITSDIDLLIGGSPCQDLSISKKDRQGLKGKRSNLFYEYIKALKELKPKWFILENVASMPKEDKNEISKIMGVEPIMINATLVSAQNRKRLFWTNIPNVEQPKDRRTLLKDILEENVDEKYFIKTPNIKSKTDKRIQWDVSGKGYSSQQDRAYNVEGKMVTLPHNRGMTKVNVFGATIRGRNLVEGAKTEQRIEIGEEKANTLTTVYKDSMVFKSHTLRSGGKSSGILDKHNWDTYKIEGTVRRLTPIECERLQGLPDNYTKGIAETKRYDVLGNAFNVDVVAHILNRLINPCNKTL